MTKLVDTYSDHREWPELRSQLPGAGQNPEKMQGHWALARAGKRVLRPGGLAMTRRMIDALSISSADRVVEFAPGMGVTAQMVLRRKPSHYWGVEREPAAAARLESRLPGDIAEIVVAPAESSALTDACATVVYGEAMLSMHPTQKKNQIFAEARRLLAPGGRYGIHELCLRPDGISESIRREIETEMSKEIHVGVKPLSLSEWKQLFDQNGFEVAWRDETELNFLEPWQVLHDEGLARCLMITVNLVRNAVLRKRILAIRRIFRRYGEFLGAVSMVGRRTDRVG